MIFRPAILYIDDEQANLETFKRAFGADFLVKTCLSAAEALKILEVEDFPLIIADQRMPGMTGIELCERLIGLKPQSVRMILTAYTEAELLLDAIHRGHVHDYLVKPWKKSELKPLFEKTFEEYKQRALKLHELEERASQTQRLEEEIQSIYDFENIIGVGGGLSSVMESLRRVAPTDSTVLLLGETGTGKELLARAVHRLSKRCRGPLISVHCAALAKTVIESELFGHEKGAFTGADQRRIGRFEQASGGTLFLDEIGELGLEVQVKLLRVLQEREIDRVGGNRPISVDVRLIAATHRDLKQEVQAGRFREDLYYRLNVIPIFVPPLRERMQDIELLSGSFLKKFNHQVGKSLTLSVSALDQLKLYDWPGNVRELQNILERAVILTAGPYIDAEDLNLHLEEMLQVERLGPEQILQTLPLRSQIREEEKQSLTQALRQAHGNISETARILGVARSTLFHRLKKYGLMG